MKFLRNAWYMAAWAHELPEGSIVSRKILGKPVAIYRLKDGTVGALYDRCPHRFAPLSRGKVKDDGTIECGYHGLRFGTEGRCVANPFGGPIPSAAKVEIFPVVERHKAIWIWPGDADKADPSLIVNYKYHDNADYRMIYGQSVVSSHYELITDNLLDLSHSTFVHPAFGGELWLPEHKLRQEGDTVISSYFAGDMENPAWGRAFLPNVDRVDEWDDIMWDAPSCLQLETRYGHAGRPKAEAQINPSSHILTPCDENASLYFWASGVGPGVTLSDEAHREFMTQAFDHEDKPMIEALVDRMDGLSFWDSKPILLANDSAAIRARRVLEKKIKMEAALSEASPARAAAV